MNLDHVLSPTEFYVLTLQTNGIKPVDQSIEKTAAALGVTPEIAAVAKAFYEQLGLDGVKYAEVEGRTAAQARAADALEMAKAYVEHKTAVFAQTVTEVDGLLAKVAEAVKVATAEFPALASMPVSELLGIAALQQESAEAYEAEEAKTAARQPKSAPEAAAKAEGAAKPEATPAAPAPVEKTPGWLSRNKAAVIPAAIAGAGVAYALHARSKAKQKAKDAEEAAALPVAP